MTITREGFCLIGSEGNAPSKNSTILADLFVTGECLRGQNVHQNKYPQTELGKPLRFDIIEYWTQKIVWYQIIGGENPRNKLYLRRDSLQTRREELLLLAPTETVKKQVTQLERSYALLQQEIAVAELVMAVALSSLGFIARHGEFYFGDKKMNTESTLKRLLAANKTVHDLHLTVRPSRVGLAPGVLLYVKCVVPPLSTELKCVDSFDAYLPCRYEGHTGHFAYEQESKCYSWPTSHYDDLHAGDIAASLTRVFLARNPHLETTGAASVLRFCGRVVAPHQRAHELFLQRRGCTVEDELYSENVVLVVYLAPPAPAAREPSMQEILGEVAAEFADSIIAELSNEELGEGDDY